MIPQSGFRRLILELGLGEASPETVRAAAAMARRLGAELHCVFIEDAALFDLTGYGFARELRLPAHRWQPIETDRLVAEMSHLADVARRMLAKLGDGIAPGLEVLRGDPAACLTAMCETGDIVVLAESLGRPRTMLARDPRLREAARRSAASVLLLPPASLDNTDCVAVLVTDPADPSLDAACRIALALELRLVVLLAGTEAAAVIERATRLGIPGSRIACRTSVDDAPATILAALSGVQAALLVVGPQARLAHSPALAAEIARTRGLPVLVAEPTATPRHAAAAAPPD